MITVARLIEELKKFPPDALAYAYEGEITGIVIVGKEIRHRPDGGKGRDQLGHILASEGRDDDNSAKFDD